MTVDILDAPVVEAPRRRRRLVAVLVGAVLGVTGLAAITVAVAQRGTPAPSAPIFASSDGLPAVLVPGDSYIATLSVAIPADWSSPNAFNEQLPVGLGATLGTSNNPSEALILCTGSASPGDIATLSCPFIAPATAGTKVTILFAVGTRTYVGTTPVIPPQVQHTYTHTVR